MSDEVFSLVATKMTQQASSICIHTLLLTSSFITPPTPPPPFFTVTVKLCLGSAACVSALIHIVHMVKKKICYYSLMGRNQTEQWFCVLSSLMGLHLHDNLFCIHVNHPPFPLQLPHTSDPSLTCALYVFVEPHRTKQPIILPVTAVF